MDAGDHGRLTVHRAFLLVTLAGGAWVGWGRLMRWRYAQQLRPSLGPWPPLESKAHLQQ